MNNPRLKTGAFLRAPTSLILPAVLIIGFFLPGEGEPSAQALAADSLHLRGENHLNSSRYDSARADLEAEVGMREQMSDSSGLAAALCSLAEALCRLRDPDGGLRAAERGLAVVRRTAGENSATGGRAWACIGLAHRAMLDYDAALEDYRRSLAIRLRLPGRHGSEIAAVYNALGNIHNQRGEYRRALDDTRKALAAITGAGPETPDLAATYNNLAGIYCNLGEYQRALDAYSTALAIKTRLFGADHPALVSNLQGIGNVCYETGDYPKGLDFQTRALAVELKALGPDDPDIARCHSNLAVFDRALGRYQDALGEYRQALAIQLKTVGARHPDVATTHNNLGNVYGDLGDFDNALKEYSAALAIQEQVFGPDHPTLATIHNNLGSIYASRGDFSRALDHYHAALAIRLKALGARHPDVATTHANIGYTLTRTGDFLKALASLDRSHAIRLAALAPDHPDIAETYSLIGDASLGIADFARAEKSYSRTLAIRLKALGAKHPAVAESYYDLARLARALGKSEAALADLKKSVEIIENVRSAVTGEELRQSYIEKNRERYEAIITLLLDLNRPREAFEYFERSKSKMLQDELNTQGVEIGRGELRKKLDQVKTLGRQVTTIEQQVIDEKSKPTDEQNKAKIENLTRLLARTKGEFYLLVSEIKQNPDYAFTVTVDPIQFASIQQDLPEGEKLIMFYSSKEKLYILVVSKAGFRAKSVEIAKDSLDRLVKDYRAILDRAGADTLSPTPDPLVTAAAVTLYRYLIGPIQDEVDSAHTLTFIPSGNLFYIPLGALAHEKDGKLRYLVEDKPITYLTSAELFRSVERKVKQGIKQYSLLVVGDPAGAGLPNAAEEAKAIHVLYPASKLYLQAEAKKVTVAEEASSFQILHLATHVFTNRNNPWDSYIYLVKSGEDNGRWTMAEVTNQTWDKMALVTLSACETAVGGDKPGLEMESMARAFSIAGSPSIVASLWPVFDPSTKELMVGFYKNLKTMSKGEALRQAQLSLLRQEKFSHPFYWAPFILIGDGR